MMVLQLAVMDADAGLDHRLIQDPAQIDTMGFPVLDRLADIQLADLADHLVEGAEAELRHQFADFLGDEEEEVDDMFGGAGEAFAQDGVLGRDADGAGIQVALAHHDAAGGDQRRGGEAELVGPEQGADDDVAAGAEAAVDLDDDARAQSVQHQGLLGFGEADFPGGAGMGQRRERAGAGATLVAGDGHVVCPRFRDAGGDGADTDLGD